MNKLVKYSEKTFEDIKHINEYGEEFWYARELQEALKYSEWRNFINTIEKAKNACKTSGFEIQDHFVGVNKMVEIGSGAERKIDDIILSRYACYLIIMNGNPKNEVIAVGQTYFAVKTRHQEITSDCDMSSEEQVRLGIRNEMIKHNKLLAIAAKKAGIVEPLEYAKFQNSGYNGLYGGLNMKAIHERKGLKKSQKILDYMGSTELAANLFRATQTEEKLRRDNIQGKDEANNTHYEVGQKVRKTIQELGGIMPEDLPTPQKSIKQIEREIEQNRLNNKDI